MYLLFISLHEEEFLDNIISALVEAEVTDADVIEGRDLLKILSEDIPIFTGLLKGLSGLRPITKNIFAKADNKEQVQRFLDIIKSEGIDFSEPGVGSVMLIPAELYIGSGPTI